MLPADFPPASTVRGHFYEGRDSALLSTINGLLLIGARELEGRQASLTAGMIDSQSVKTTESGGDRGYDAGKQLKRHKRHIVTDTLGLMLTAVINAADIQDRDGATTVLKPLRYRYPCLRHIFADGSYAGEKLRRSLRGHGNWTIEIIKRSDTAKGFKVLPSR